MKWKRKTNRVYGQGQSYTLNNIKNAEQLQNTLNTYEATKGNKTTDQIQKQVTRCQMTLNTLKDELEILSEMIK